jgi:predicted transcriptional regulator YdeE
MEFDMNGGTAWTLYETRLRRVSAYIHEEKLADIACMSSYHWHRIYRAIYGETAAATVKRLRLHRTAAPLERRTTVGGEYAVLWHKGPYADMYKAYQRFFAEWLPASGRQPRDAVMFEEYLNCPHDCRRPSC